MAKYHVTDKWDGNDIESAADRLGEEQAIEMFMAKWGTDDASYAADQVTKVYLYASIEEARNHQDALGGEILEINDEFLTVFVDYAECLPVLATWGPINKDDIKRI